MNMAELSNSLANISIIAASENNRISDSDPNNYLPAFAALLGDQAESVFESNYMPIPSRFSYASQDYSSFLDERSRLLQNAIDQLCKGH